MRFMSSVCWKVSDLDKMKCRLIFAKLLRGKELASGRQAKLLSSL